MKKIITLLLFVGFTFISCTGPAGPQGPQGTYVVGETLERTVSFKSGNDYSNVIKFSSPIYDSDVVLVYILDKENSANFDVWRPLPTTFYDDLDGAIDYNFDFSSSDVNVFMDADYDLGLVPSRFLLDQTFRIVILPSDPSSRGLSRASYSEVVQTLNIKDTDFRKVN